MSEISSELASYLEVFINNYEHLLRNEIALRKSIPQAPPKHPSSAENDEDADKIFYSLFVEFNRVVTAAYDALNRDQKITASQIQLGRLIEIFAEEIELPIPIFQQRVKEQFDVGIKLISDRRLLNDFRLLIEQNNVDLRKCSILILRYFVSKIVAKLIDKLFSQSQVFQNFFAENGLVDFDLKYRPKGLDDLNEIVFEELEKVNQVINEKTRIHQIVFIFTNIDSHEYDQIIYRFRGLLYDNQPDLIDRIRLLPVNLFKLGELQSTLTRVLESVVEDISQNKVDSVSVADMFKGTWVNEFVMADGKTGTEQFRVDNGNSYKIKEGRIFRHVFDLDRVTINYEKRIFKFRKKGIGSDKRVAFNSLSISNDKLYIGDEMGNKVTYHKR